MKKKALIFGVTGQDGSYLSEFLLKKGYEVHGVKRRSSSINTQRIDHIYQDPHEKLRNFFLHYGDITDSTVVSKLIKEISPHEIYNLAAQSHVAVSFEVSEYTANADAIGALRILEAIRFHGLEKKTKFYQAGTSEMYGKVMQVPQNEKTPFYPRSPYGVAKVYAHWITVNYREAYNIFAANGILFNHESPRRGGTFVTKKIVDAVKNIVEGNQELLILGNINSKRDWGHAKDYVRAMWMILQRDTPEDYVVSSNTTMSVREFVEKSFKFKGINIVWEGEGLEEVGKNKDNGKILVKISEKYFRPCEVENLYGDSTKIRNELGWKPTYNTESLIEDMFNN